MFLSNRYKVNFVVQCRLCNLALKYKLKKNPGLPRPFLNMFNCFIGVFISYNFGSYLLVPFRQFVISPFRYFAILPFCHFAILPFRYFVISPFRVLYTPTDELVNSLMAIWLHLSPQFSIQNYNLHVHVTLNDWSLLDLNNWMAWCKRDVSDFFG